MLGDDGRVGIAQSLRECGWGGDPGVWAVLGVGRGLRGVDGDGDLVVGVQVGTGCGIRRGVYAFYG